MTSLRIGALAGIFLLSVFAVGSQFANAQVQGIELQPGVVEDRVSPGDLYRFTINVRNVSGQTQTFYLGAQDITGLDDAGLPIFTDEDLATEFELASWIRFPAESITLASNEERAVTFSVQVPQSAAPGSHFGAVFFDLRPPEQQTQGASIGFRVGSVVSLRLAGESQEDMSLREFSTDKLIYGAAQVLFNTRTDNNGNVLMRPNGLIEITDMWGNMAGQVEVNETGAPVFPGGDRTYTTRWESDKFAFGRYQAVVSLVYGEDSRETISATTSFWILPLKPILYTLGLALIVILALYGFIRSTIRRRLRAMGVSQARVDANLQAARMAKPISRLTTIAFSVVVLTVVFLIVLLYFLA